MLAVSSLPVLPALSTAFTVNAYSFVSESASTFATEYDACVTFSSVFTEVPAFV